MSAIRIIRQHKGKLTGVAAGLALARALVFHREGEKLVASHNRFDPPGVIDVCNGVTNRELPWLKAGMKFTHEDCEALRMRLLPKYRDPLRKSTVCNSQAVRRLNAGDIAGGCRALGNFIKADKIVLKGLIDRRHDSNWGGIAWCMENE